MILAWFQQRKPGNPFCVYGLEDSIWYMLSVLPKVTYRFNVIHVKMPEGVCVCERDRQTDSQEERERRLSDWQADSGTYRNVKDQQ